MKREINLITDEFLFDPFGKVKPILLAGWLFCLIGLLGWMIVSKGLEIKRTSQELTRLQSHLSQLSKEEADLTEFIKKNGLANDETSFQQSIPWVEILSTIGTMVPEGAWLKSFEGGIKQEGKDQPAVKQIKMAGFAYSHAPITLLLSRLERQPLFSEIHLIYTQKGETVDDHDVHFEMTGRLH